MARDAQWTTAKNRWRLHDVLLLAVLAHPEHRPAFADALKTALAGTTDSFNTNSHYCLSVVRLMSTAVSAIIGGSSQ